jgi:hypothetical protein
VVGFKPDNFFLLAVVVKVHLQNHGLIKEGFWKNEPTKFWLIKEGFSRMGQPVNTSGCNLLKTNLYSIALL